MLVLAVLFGYCVLALASHHTREGKLLEKALERSEWIAHFKSLVSSPDEKLRIFLWFLGLLLGFVVVFVGAAYLLTGDRALSYVSVELNGSKSSLETRAPGLVLIVLGMCFCMLVIGVSPWLLEPKSSTAPAGGHQSGGPSSSATLGTSHKPPTAVGERPPPQRQKKDVRTPQKKSQSASSAEQKDMKRPKRRKKDDRTPQKKSRSASSAEQKDMKRPTHEPPRQFAHCGPR